MTLANMDQYIRSVKLDREKVSSFSEYPYCLAAISNLTELKLHTKVTFVVGENGTGKSTILEAIAAAYGFNPEGGTINFNFSTNNTHSALYMCSGFCCKCEVWEYLVFQAFSIYSTIRIQREGGV